MITRPRANHGAAENRSMSGVNAPRLVDDHRRPMHVRHHRVVGDEHGLRCDDDRGVPLRRPLGLGVGRKRNGQHGRNKECSTTIHIGLRILTLPSAIPARGPYARGGKLAHILPRSFLSTTVIVLAGPESVSNRTKRHQLGVLAQPRYLELWLGISSGL